MIQAVSATKSVPTFNQKYTTNPTPEKKSEKYKKYADSFFKNAKESTPMLLGFTSIITVLDYGKKQEAITKILKKNLLKYFAPILIATSLLCATIENRKTKKV